MFPTANRYFEPFVGGGALLPHRPSREAIAGDIIEELIDLWECIRDRPSETADAYEVRWLSLQREGHSAYYKIRDTFNSDRDPHDFLFLSRTCVSGLIRFNGSGDFNNSLHHTRPGISPQRLRRIIAQWSTATKEVQFVKADYREALAGVRRGDLVFLDPPYAGTKGRYSKVPFELQAFYNELDRLNTIGAKWILTFDGQAGRRSYDSAPPEDLYRARFGLLTGNSPFTKLMNTSIDGVVESVYLNFDAPAESLYRAQHRRAKGTGSTGEVDMQHRLLLV
ncbi:MAG: DNA adenine methylase [Flavobacteriales bacterium]|nr:DNA adenine methylase [Flavobacteriales bacterium]